MRSPRPRTRCALRPALLTTVLLLGLTSCAGDGAGGGSPGPAASGPGPTRIEAVQAQLDTWAGASDLATAREAAEGVVNLVVGRDGPYYGDATGDDVVTAPSPTGLLPGLDGQRGLAEDAVGNACVEADVLGGSWADPAERWDVLDTAIDDWSATGNTFPALPSHPQRVVGWARLTLAAGSLEEAREYAGHAQLHVDVSRAAYACS